MVALSCHLWNNECLNFQEENNMVTLHTNFGDIKIKLDFDKA
ncbi:MAG: peptidylprolyl isomerase, partial [Haemophilus parainfluenzae]|nr:peptidylprolyl isomerase [Haemophilus parainfluenzae]